MSAFYTCYDTILFLSTGETTVLSKILFLSAQYLLPHHLVSRLIGYVARSNIFAVRYYLIRWFIDHYQVDMSQATEKNIHNYKSFNDFFTRALQADARPFSSLQKDYICPADGVVSACGVIENNTLIQAKDHTYSVASLLADDDDKFHFAQFATVYLAPKDYHRVHIPTDAILREMRYVPGRLFSVNNTTAEHVPNLFARNERLICLFDTKEGMVVCVLVGAMIVAGIATSWTGTIAPVSGRVLRWSNQQIALKKGDELGCFFLGSTVIMLLPKGVQLDETIITNATVRMGQTIASCA